MSRNVSLMLMLCALPLGAQERADQVVMNQILQRLDALEKENRDLLVELRTLRQQLQPPKPENGAQATASPPEKATTEERLAVDESRIEEQAQTKIEASQKFPIQLNGVLLFNAFANSAARTYSNASDDLLLTGPERSGATLRQTLLGLNFQGPRLPGDGHVNGSLMMDFWAGPPEPGNSWLRIRRAEVSLDWTNRSFSVGQDKPLISPYQPTSFAEVGVPPLAGAGNLWLWLPQARYEERLHIGESSGITGQVAIMQTDELYNALPAGYSNTLSKARPAIEGRAAFWHKFGEKRRLEIAPGFHASTTHVAGSSIPSRIGSVDWLFNTGAHFDITGTFYHGQNVAGLGALNNGFAISDARAVRPVHSTGGWTQFAVPLSSRLSLNLFSGIEDDRGIYTGQTTARDLTYASNLIYRLGPNVLLSFEALQSRTRSAAGENSVRNHYDLALGYLF